MDGSLISCVQVPGQHGADGLPAGDQGPRPGGLAAGHPPPARGGGAGQGRGHAHCGLLGGARAEEAVLSLQTPGRVIADTLCLL